MTNEIVLGRLDNILSDLTRLGGASERTGIQTGLVVVDIAPTGLANHIIVQDNRDGDYIPVLKSPGATYAVNDLVSVLFIEGTEPIAFTQSPGSSSPGTLTDNQSFIVLNSSGASASANDIGYIDKDGDYQTTTTANLDNVAWCVVIQGGDDATDIYVAKRGRVTINYTGSAPADGDFLSTSTVAGSAQAESVMRPDIFARCLEAGSGGTVTALLLTGRAYTPLINSNNILRLSTVANADFVSTVAAATAIGDKIYHKAVTSGTVANITPFATTELGKIVLHNTDANEEAFIIDTGTDGTGDFIQVTDSADISSWVEDEAITVRSQTNTTAQFAPAYYYDLDFAEEDAIPELTTVIFMFLAQSRDSGAIGERVIYHPFETNSNPKRRIFHSLSTTVNLNTEFTLPLISRRLCTTFEGSGVGTIPTYRFTVTGVVLATP